MYFVSRRRSAFTLVEVLVVLGILALLSAILFPVFNAAKSAARKATCQNNEHQIGLAMQLYLSDYNRFYPNLLAHPDECSWSYNIAPYVKSNAIFSCPEEPLKSFAPGCPPTKSEGDLRFDFKGAYGFNVPNYNSSRGVQMSDVRIKSPSQMILVIDGDGDHLGVGKEQKTGPLSSDDLTSMGVALRHKGGANALFADGHVKWMSLDALTDRSHWTLSGRG